MKYSLSISNISQAEHPISKANMDQSELLQKHAQSDLLRSITVAVLQLIVEADVDGRIGTIRPSQDSATQYKTTLL